MRSAPSEPGLADRVPEKSDAVTPDLPPFGPGAPDLPDAGHERTRHAGPEKDDGEENTSVANHSEENAGAGSKSEDDERPTPGPGHTKPHEPTD
ncbi:hypothetical protein ACFVX6_16100 [Streptomyces sp. NPDC058289]|uniref:hypothetical protein n=1 Tax=Streptomyces sp. NPDC058289 TaxID=3346425 RepID=UPI0036E1B706